MNTPQRYVFAVFVTMACLAFYTGASELSRVLHIPGGEYFALSLVSAGLAGMVLRLGRS